MSDNPVSDEILDIGKADPGYDGDNVTILRADLEAYRAAAKALKRYHWPPSRTDAKDCPCCNCEGERAIAGLRAAGILEGE